ncbi:hypothetical protein C8F01DRAFT_1079653 [Mycena amicta]|nr:hypothetical protein C8F01DRAFT_1079653 [Mycena amicta]
MASGAVIRRRTWRFAVNHAERMPVARTGLRCQWEAETVLTETESRCPPGPRPVDISQSGRRPSSIPPLRYIQRIIIRSNSDLRLLAFKNVFALSTDDHLPRSGAGRTCAVELFRQRWRAPPVLTRREEKSIPTAVIMRSALQDALEQDQGPAVPTSSSEEIHLPEIRVLVQLLAEALRKMSTARRQRSDRAPPATVNAPNDVLVQQMHAMAERVAFVEGQLRLNRDGGRQGEESPPEYTAG